MTRIGIALVALACASVAHAQGRASQPPAQLRNPSLDVQAEQQTAPVLNQFEAAWNRDDTRSMAAAYAPDAVLIQPMGCVARGRAEIQRQFDAEHGANGPMRDTTFSRRVTDVKQLAPGLAMVDQRITITGAKVAPGGATRNLDVHASMILANRNGQWQIVEARAYGFMPPPPQGVGGAAQAGMQPEHPKFGPPNPSVQPTKRQ